MRILVLILTVLFSGSTILAADTNDNLSAEIQAIFSNPGRIRGWHEVGMGKAEDAANRLEPDHDPSKNAGNKQASRAAWRKAMNESHNH